MKRMITIVVSAIGGLIFATVVVWAGWNTQIERRAYQCNDDIWPCAWITTDMSDHRDAGDTLSPGWTWEKIEDVGRMYRIGFFVLWAGATALISTVSIKRREQNKPVEAIRR